jgi:hypothetical protein
MTTPRGIKPRGTAKEPVPIGYRVERSAKDRFDAIAARAGVSKAIMFESMVEHVQLDEDGLPTWWADQKLVG